MLEIAWVIVKASEGTMTLGIAVTNDLIRPFGLVAAGRVFAANRC